VTPATLLVAPGELASLAGAYGVIPLAVIWWSRHGSPAWLRNLFSACLSTALTLAAVEPLKGVFGRTWPESWAGFNPSWIRDGVYGFHWFHQGIAYQSFPSGHMAAICSFVVPLWLAYPRLRWACVVCCLMVATGLLGGNYHFLSDILAGAVLGLAGGILATRLLAPALSGRQLER
jgi:membrane-associated phospholipid phosphatase